MTESYLEQPAFFRTCLSDIRVIMVIMCEVPEKATRWEVNES
jgi:hypothetical protein